MEKDIKAQLEEAYRLDAIANKGSDELIARVDRYRSRNAPRREIVRKTYEPPAQQSTDLDPATQARWDTWLDQRVADHLAEFADVMGEETARMVQSLIETRGKDLAHMREIVAIEVSKTMTVAINAVRDLLKAEAADGEGKVIDLPLRSRSGNAA